MLADEIPTQREPPRHSPVARTSLGAAPGHDGIHRARTLGRYRLLFPIARGGMGAVYAAVSHSESGAPRTFAIKVLRSEDKSRDEVDALVREARLTTQISHPNVLETFELGMADAEPFIVMPLVKGVTLAKLLAAHAKRHEILPPVLVAWLGAEIASGLHAAHDATDVEGRPLGIVHRDVSPQNVLLSFDGRVQLLDFGVAKFFEAARATESGVIKGKFGYMSPEQLRCEPLDRRSDVFALGVMLFELCTGRSLYADLPPASAALKIVNDPTPRLRDVLPTHPAISALDELVARAMAKDKSDRFDTALELRDALRSFISAQPAPPLELATLLGEDFATEREAFELRLRSALRGAADAAPVEAPPEPAAAPPASTRTATVSPLSSSPAPRRLPLLAASAALGVVAGLVWAVSQRSATGPSAALDQPSSNTGEQVPPGEPPPSARAQPDPPSELSAPSVSAPKRSGAAPSSRVGRPPTQPKTTASQRPGPVAPPASTSTVGGTPFRDL